jgi:hypothetical protein
LVSLKPVPALAIAFAIASVAPYPYPFHGRLRLDVDLCTIEAPAGAEPALRSLSARAPAILERVETDLGCRPAARYRFVLIPPGVPTDPDVRALERSAPPWAAGFVLRGARLGAIRVAEAARYPYGTLESVLAHESCHVLLQDAVPAGLPLWFEEGVATREGRRWSMEDVLAYSGAVLADDLPSLDELSADFQGPSEERVRRAYAASFAFVGWASRDRESLVRDVVRAARGRPFAAAWRSVTGAPLADAEGRWRHQALVRYRWIAALTASSTLWIALSLLAMVAGIVRRRRARLARAEWERREQDLPLDDGLDPPFE